MSRTTTTHIQILRSIRKLIIWISGFDSSIFSRSMGVFSPNFGVDDSQFADSRFADRPRTQRWKRKRRSVPRQARYTKLYGLNIQTNNTYNNKQ